MRTDTPQTIHRADYQPLSWNITHADLHFALDPAATLVTSRLTLTRNLQAPRGPLVNAEWLEARVVNLPSSVLPEATTQ